MKSQVLSQLKIIKIWIDEHQKPLKEVFSKAGCAEAAKKKRLKKLGGLRVELK